MGLIDDCLEKVNRGYCDNKCKHLVFIDEMTLGCRALDKLILTEFPPYTIDSNKLCEEYERVIK